MIESNLAAKTLRISLNGVDVLRDDAVFCPLGEDKVACAGEGAPATKQAVTIR